MVIHQKPNLLLENLKILDLSRVLAGPFCTQILGDYGAEVIKIEDINAGDITRSWGPPFAGEFSAYYLSANRNKKSLALNLKTPQGQVILGQLAKKCDVVVSNFLPKTAQSLKADYATLSAYNPKLIYCAITGYGYHGPFKNQPGFDLILQAETGFMAITGPKKGEPFKVGVAIVDIITGLYAVSAILAALYRRKVDHKGRFIDVALFDAAIASLSNITQNTLVTNLPSQRHGNAHPSIVPYQTFKTSDGFIAIAIGTDQQFQRLCALLAQPSLPMQKIFTTNALRVTHSKILNKKLETILQKKTASYWLKLCKKNQIPAAKVANIKTALASEYSKSRGIVAEKSRGKPALLNPVVEFDGKKSPITKRPPKLGEDTNSILTELLKLTKTEIKTLSLKKIISP